MHIFTFSQGFDQIPSSMTNPNYGNNVFAVITIVINSKEYLTNR